MENLINLLSKIAYLTKGGQYMQISARNFIKGTVKNVEHGAVNSVITVEVAPSIEIFSLITKASAEKLGLAEGKEAYVVIKSSNVMVAVD